MPGLYSAEFPVPRFGIAKLEVSTELAKGLIANHTNNVWNCDKTSTRDATRELDELCDSICFSGCTTTRLSSKKSSCVFSNPRCEMSALLTCRRKPVVRTNKLWTLRQKQLDDKIDALCSDEEIRSSDDKNLSFEYRGCSHTKPLQHERMRVLTRERLKSLSQSPKALELSGTMEHRFGNMLSSGRAHVTRSSSLTSPSNRIALYAAQMF